MDRTLDRKSENTGSDIFYAAVNDSCPAVYTCLSMIFSILNWEVYIMGSIRTQSDDMTDLMTSEYTDTVSTQDVPEADGAVRRSCGQIIGVGVETGTRDIS